MDKQHRYLGRTQNFERIHRIQLIRNNLRFAHQRPDIERLAADLRRHNIARLDHADDIVGAVPCHRQACVERMDQSIAHLILRRIDRYPVNIGARCHNLSHRAVGEANDTSYYFMFVFLNQADMGCLGKDHAQFFGSQRLPAIAA